MMVQRISREEEAELPVFKSYNEARAFFLNRYGDNFMLEDVETFDDETIYFCILVIDKEAWMKGQKQMQDHGYIVGTDFINSYQSIQISATGAIHIDY